MKMFFFNATFLAVKELKIFENNRDQNQSLYVFGMLINYSSLALKACYPNQWMSDPTSIEMDNKPSVLKKKT